MVHDFMGPKTFDKVFNKKQYDIEKEQYERYQNFYKLYSSDYARCRRRLRLFAIDQEMCDKFNTLSEEDRESIRKYLYYGNCLDTYSRVLSRYVWE